MVDPARSRIMRAVKGRDTGPEMKIRCLIFAMGYRYRLHRKDLPGKPDLVFPSRRKSGVYSWLFLAWARLPAGRTDTKDQPGLLGKENRWQSGTGRSALSEFDQQGVGFSGDLGMWNE
jgi:hypothetical protein